MQIVGMRKHYLIPHRDMRWGVRQNLYTLPTAGYGPLRFSLHDLRNKYILFGITSSFHILIAYMLNWSSQPFTCSLCKEFKLIRQAWNLAASHRTTWRINFLPDCKILIRQSKHSGTPVERASEFRTKSVYFLSAPLWRPRAIKGTPGRANTRFHLRSGVRAENKGKVFLPRGKKTRSSGVARQRRSTSVTMPFRFVFGVKFREMKGVTLGGGWGGRRQVGCSRTQ